MRIWDIPCSKLCRSHLLGEHRELHAIWTYLTTDKGHSYRRHPETLRWKGKLWALRVRHEQQVKEMEDRGYKHNSPINDLYPITDGVKPWQTLDEQIAILKAKGCQCDLSTL